MSLSPSASAARHLIPDLRIAITPSLSRQESDPLFSLLSAQTPVNVTTVESTELHTAVLRGSVSEATHVLIQRRAREGPDAVGFFLNRKNERGYTALMCAASLDDEHLSTAMIDVLIQHGASVESEDLEGFTALHWAAACGGEERIRSLTAAGADVNRAATQGDTPLHRAARFGRAGAIQELVARGSNSRAQNSDFLVPIDVAGHYMDAYNPEYRATACKTLNLCDPSLRTLILHHADCLRHEGREGHQEAPQRITAILDRLRDEAYGLATHEAAISDAVPFATDEQILRAHSSKFLQLVLALDSHVRKHNYSVPFTPHIQRGLKGHTLENVKPAENSDTPFSIGSLPAARRAAGAVCAAVDAVVGNRARHAFCCVRPPGHHAGVNGLLEDFPSSQSCGFCIFNSVAIGAFHALDHHPEDVQRIAIIDFDVHHGNGTEEIVRRWATEHRHKRNQAIYFFSVHLYDVEHTKPGGELPPQAQSNTHTTGGDGEDTDAQMKTRLRTRGAGRSRHADEEEPHEAVEESGGQEGGGEGRLDESMLDTTPAPASEAKRPTSRKSRKSGGRSNKRARRNPPQAAAEEQREVSPEPFNPFDGGLQPWDAPLQFDFPVAFNVKGALVSHLYPPHHREEDGTPGLSAVDSEVSKSLGRKRRRPAKYDDSDSSSGREAEGEHHLNVSSAPAPPSASDSFVIPPLENMPHPSTPSVRVAVSSTGSKLRVRKRGADSIDPVPATSSDPQVVAAPEPAAVALVTNPSSPLLPSPLLPSPVHASPHAADAAAAVKVMTPSHSTPPLRRSLSAQNPTRPRAVSFSPGIGVRDSSSDESDDKNNANGDPAAAAGTSKCRDSPKTDEDADPALYVTDAGISLTPRKRSASFTGVGFPLKRSSSAPMSSPSGLQRIASYAFGNTPSSSPSSLALMEGPSAATTSVGSEGMGASRSITSDRFEGDKHPLQRRSSFDIIPSAGVFVRASPNTSGGEPGAENPQAATLPASSPGWKPEHAFATSANPFVDVAFAGAVPGRLLIVDAAASLGRTGTYTSFPPVHTPHPRGIESSSYASPKPKVATDSPTLSPVVIPPLRLGQAAPDPQLLLPISGQTLANASSQPVAFATSLHGAAYAMMAPPTKDASTVDAQDDIVYSFYPGTGAEDSVPHNCWNSPIPPLWRERRETKAKNRDPRKAQNGRLAVRKAITDHLVPSLRAFGPDLILISAGFDGGHGDVGNSKNDGRATPGMNLSPEDFAWITSEIMGVARICCPGRVVSVLEGGYGQWKWRKVPAPFAPFQSGPQTGAAASSSSSSNEAGAPPAFFPDTASTHSSTAGGEQGMVATPYLQRDILAENCFSHVKALIEDGGIPVAAGDAGNTSVVEDGHK